MFAKDIVDERLLPQLILPLIRDRSRGRVTNFFKDFEKENQKARPKLAGGEMMSGCDFDLRNLSQGPGIILRLIENRAPMGRIDFVNLVNVSENVGLLNKFVSCPRFFEEIGLLSLSSYDQVPFSEFKVVSTLVPRLKALRLEGIDFEEEDFSSLMKEISRSKKFVSLDLKRVFTVGGEPWRDGKGAEMKAFSVVNSMPKMIKHVRFL